MLNEMKSRNAGLNETKAHTEVNKMLVLSMILLGALCFFLFYKSIQFFDKI